MKMGYLRKSQIKLNHLCRKMNVTSAPLNYHRLLHILWYKLVRSFPRMQFIFIAYVFRSIVADGEHVFLDLDVKLAKYAPPKWKDEVIVNYNLLN